MKGDQMKIVVTKEHNFPRTYDVDLPYETKTKIYGILGWAGLVLAGAITGRLVVMHASRD
jgi:hypothetical protein